jgi:signal transduction histidine kinase
MNVPAERRMASIAQEAHVEDGVDGSGLAQPARQDVVRPAARSGSPVLSLLFALYVASAVLWLLAGLVPALARTAPSFHAALHDWGRGSGLFAEIADHAARASHNSYASALVVLEYAFSALNVGLGVFLWVRGPKRAEVRVLAVAMVGTAVAFNLQGHWARQVIPTGWLGGVEIWHNLVHVTAGLAYVFALLLFPTGRLLHPRRAPLIAILMVFLVGVALFTVEDHTLGLVILFGVITPLAGAISQLGRYRRATSPEERRVTRGVLAGLLVALTSGLVLIVSISVLGSGTEGVTRDFEVPSLAAGVYFFRCDPHPTTMQGFVTVSTGEADPTGSIEAFDGKFDTKTMRFPAGSSLLLSFTNRDGDPHNVAIYTDATASEALFVGDVFSGNDLTYRAFRVFQVVFVVIPLTLFVGIVRFRLWAFRRAVHRTIVYAVIGTLVIVLTVGGQLPLMPVVIVALLALAVPPVRRELQRLTNRVVYGRPTSPYEVITDFSGRIAGSLSIDEILPRMAEAAARGVGAVRGRVRVFLPGERAWSATWPEGAPDGEWTRTMTVRHEGTAVGDIWVAVAEGDRLTPKDDRMLADLVSQSGPALQNVRLAAELEARLEEISRQAAELRASRQRIVAAQDAAARRLERDIHDGAQQHLVAIAVTAKLIQQIAAADPERAAELLAKLAADADDALQNLRDLARGIYPPLLSDKGLAAALGAHLAKSGLPVALEVGSIGRYASGTEAAAYFCCLEALQNVSKYAHATRTTLTLGDEGGQLVFTVRDDGRGFDPVAVPPGEGLRNMEDRLSALGGSLEVRSAPGRGTSVTGRLPITPRGAPPAPPSFGPDAAASGNGATAETGGAAHVAGSLVSTVGPPET